MRQDSSKNKLATCFFDVAVAANKGARDYQEDTVISNFALGQKHGFAIIADGMGGHCAGDIASALVASEIFAHFKIHISDIEEGSNNLPLILREGAERANDRLTAYSHNNPITKGMGTTLLAPIISGDKLSWISIGDSPLLLFRDGALRMLNKDHSMAPQIDMMVKTGIMDAELAKDHPDRNVLTSVINGEDIAKIDCPSSTITLIEDDIIIAATDGLQFLSNAAIANLIMQMHHQESAFIADALMDAVFNVESPTQDNVSFVVIKVGAKVKEGEGLDAAAMPVLATAEDVEVPEPEPVAAEAAASEAAPKKKLKTYFYRGKEYTKEV